ncbi:MAG TPA: DUF424 family protein [Candidatus Pacearchaeota archaeon]|nr:DUF424 family protein [Candidatus Pacearchaeota archaeon]
MFVNIIKSYRNVVAVCDKELIGKRFEEGKFQLDVKENFFKGKEVSEEEVLRIMKNMKLEDSTFNIVGKKAVNIAIKAEIITEDGVGNIANIPFALVLM